MADTVTTQTIADTSGVKFVAKLTNFSDGTGETLVKKIDASEVTFMTEDANRKISRVWYSINTSNAKSGVEIIWDGATNATAMLLGGNGYFDLRTGEPLNEPADEPIKTYKTILDEDRIYIEI